MIDLQILITPYCPPCAHAAQMAEKLTSDFPDLRVTKVDLTEQPKMAMKYQVFAAPGVVINGKLEFHGGVNESQLRDKLWRLHCS